MAKRQKRIYSGVSPSGLTEVLSTRVDVLDPDNGFTVEAVVNHLTGGESAG